MEALSSSETSVRTRAARCNIPEDVIHHSHRRENLKSYIALTDWALLRRRNVSPVRYELGLYTPEDGFLHSHRRENLKSYIALTDWALLRRRNVSPVRYELDLYTPEDDILRSHGRRNLNSYMASTAGRNRVKRWNNAILFENILWLGNCILPSLICIREKGPAVFRVAKCEILLVPPHNPPPPGPSHDTTSNKTNRKLVGLLYNHNSYYWTYNIVLMCWRARAQLNYTTYSYLQNDAESGAGGGGSKLPTSKHSHQLPHQVKLLCCTYFCETPKSRAKNKKKRTATAFGRIMGQSKLQTSYKHSYRVSCTSRGTRYKCCGVPQNSNHFNHPDISSSTSKVKLSAVTDCGGLQGCEMVRIPHCLDSRLQDREMVRIPYCLDSQL
jgi:hypothetical protein